MIFDIHSHLLPDIDDGSPDMAHSVQLVREQMEDGVTEMILTPHYHLGLWHEPKDKVLDVYEKFCQALKDADLNVKIHLGHEAHDCPEMFGQLLDGKFNTLAGTKYFLLELDWRLHNTDAAGTVKEYVNAGYTPIIVHYERFFYKSIEELMSMREQGALFQINAYSLLGCESEEFRDFALRMLDEGLVDFVASDYHFKKPRKLKEAYELVGIRYGEETRDRLFYGNAKQLFG